jgi:hypothetical protein
MKWKLEDMVHQSENMRRLWIMKGGRGMILKCFIPRFNDEMKVSWK